MELTAERIRELFDYNPETGSLRWRKTRGGVRAGVEAGTIVTESKRCQYRVVMLSRRPQRAHRIAWLYVYGQWPTKLIDHIDGNGLNNAIANLREASHAENLQNRGANSNNSSGYKGVSWNRDRQKWQAQITVNRKHSYLGLFDDPQKAHEAYCAAAQIRHGTFARGQ